MNHTPYRPVAPDMVIAWASPDAPDRPIGLMEARLRSHPESKQLCWTWDYLDISNPDDPQYRILEASSDGKTGADWTIAYMGEEQSGRAYPYRRRDGRPVLPYVLYHAERTGDRLFDPFRWIELVEATLSLATKYQMLDHTFLQASWPQRVFVGCQPAGLGIEGEQGPRASVVVDPSSVLVLEPIDGYTGQINIAQFEPGADVSMLEATLSNLLSMIASNAGVPPSDVQRLGGTARSGAAISLTNEGKRQAQRRFSAHFRDSDERLVALTAILVNRALDTDLPEGGYSVIYQEIPLSPEETKARTDDALALVNAGLMSRLQAYIKLNPGISVEQARQDLAEIQSANLINKMTV